MQTHCLRRLVKQIPQRQFKRHPSPTKRQNIHSSHKSKSRQTYLGASHKMQPSQHSSPRTNHPECLLHYFRLAITTLPAAGGDGWEAGWCIPFGCLSRFHQSSGPGSPDQSRRCRRRHPISQLGVCFMAALSLLDKVTVGGCRFLSSLRLPTTATTDGTPSLAVSILRLKCRRVDMANDDDDNIDGKREFFN